MKKKVYIGYVHPKFNLKYGISLSNRYKCLDHDKSIWNKKLGINYKKIRITVEEVK